MKERLRKVFKKSVIPIYMNDSLEKLTHREIILSMIYLKSGNKNFRVEDLKKGLDAVSSESPRLEIPWNSIRLSFFYYSSHLSGELNLPEYRLSPEGQEIIQKKFNTYPSRLQQRLRDIAGKVWQYSRN